MKLDHTQTLETGLSVKWTQLQNASDTTQFNVFKNLNITVHLFNDFNIEIKSQT